MSPAEETMPELVYGQDDVPPPVPLIILSIQQGALLFVSVLFTVVLVQAIGGDMQTSVRMVSLTMIACGLGTILQAIRSRWVGSGYLCPNVGGPSYLAVSISAAILGGLPLMQGMIVFAGLVEIVLARVVGRLRALFPPVVVGLTVMMVGISVIPVAFADFCGAPLAGDRLLWQDIVVGAVTLLAAVAFNLWGKRAAKLYCLLLGIGVGWTVSLFLCPFDVTRYREIGEAPIFRLPFEGFGQFRLAFDRKLILPFLVISICGSLKTFGNLLAAQKITRPDLKQADMKPIVGGMTADGISTALAGLIGGIAVDTSSSNVGLAAATRAVSRWIGIVTGGIFCLLGCFPVVATAVSAMPAPVIGGALIFAVSFMIVIGIQEMLSEPMDQRKIFTAGLSIIFGLATGFVTEPFAHLPRVLQPMFSSALTATTLLGIVFYQLFHIDLTIKRWREKRRS